MQIQIPAMRSISKVNGKSLEGPAALLLSGLLLPLASIRRGPEQARLRLDFANPILYAIGTGMSYAASFHDVTTGNNLL